MINKYNNQQEFLSFLKEKLPKLLSKLDFIETKKGWNNIIYSLSYVLEDELNEDVESTNYAVQIKQKLGELRFYMRKTTPTIRRAISVAELIANKTCEECGCPGKKRSIGGYICVLCDEDYDKAIEKYETEIRSY